MSNEQQEVNSELANQVQCLQETLDHVNAYIFTKDLQGRYTYANQLVLELFGYPLDEVIGCSDSKFFSLEESDDIKINDHRVMFEGRIVDTEERNVIAKTGETRYYHSEKKPLKDRDGNIIGMFGISTDITDKKSIQSKLEELLAEQSVILNNQLVGMVTLRDRRILWANSAFETLLGYDEGELIGVPTRQCYTSDEDYQAIGMLYKDIEGGGVVRNEIEFVRKDGQFIWVTLRGSALHNNPADSIWVFIDITERKLAEEASQISTKHFQTIFEEAPLGIGVIDSLTGHIYDANPAYSKIAGRSIEELRRLDWMTITHPEDIQDDIDNMSKMNAGEQSGFTMKKRYIQPGGSVRWINMTVTPMQAKDKSKPRHLCMIEDITKRKKIGDDLERSKQVLRLLAEHGGSDKDNIFQLIVQQLATSQGVRYALIATIDPQNTSQVNTIAVWSGDKIVDNFSYSLKGTPCSNVIKSDACFYPSAIQHLFPEDHLLEDMQAESYIGVPLKTDNGHVLGIIALLDDKPMIERSQTINLLNSLSVRASIELERIESSKKLTLSARVFSDTHEGITITDADMNIIDVNPAFCEITGYSRNEVIGQNPSILSSGKQSPEFYQDMWLQINELGHWQGEMWNRKKNGEIYSELITISALKDNAENVVNYVGVFSDITSSKRQQEQLSLMAHYDVLTGLPNRALFADRFHQSIAHSKRTKSLLAVCFLDLDNFKPVNDNYGHETGDQLLVEVAKRITASIREEDTVSRQGGDEFAILLNDIDSYTQCQRSIERILLSLAQPYIIDDHPHKVTASVGITLYPEDNEDIDTLLRHADQSMYQAKLEGKHRYHLFNPQHDQMVVMKHHQLDEIGQALVNNEFQLYYQPKVNMLTGNVFGAEALIRWIHPKRGLIPPLDFLPIIEGTELELKVGNWVINEALSQLEVWHQQGIRPEVSVNISSPHLLSETFFSELDAALAEHASVDSQCLQLEILESSALGDLNAISSIIESCQGALGVKVALDDFGTGYSSLTHLRSLPANTIKIDQTFVRDMLDDPSDYAIIDGIIGLSDSFDRNVIAEGVETTNHGLMLLMMGCEEAQGYGIAKPMPADDFPQWLSSYSPNPEWQQCGNKHRSTKEIKVKLFRLVTEHWRDLFIGNIQSVPENIEHWPIMNSKRCSCGTWIARARQEQLFEVEGLEKLNKTHDALHLVAHSLQLQYEDGNINAAREGIAEFQAAFDDVNNALGLCE